MVSSSCYRKVQRGSMASFNSLLAKINGENRIHPECLLRRVKDNRLINVFRQADPRASGLGRPHSLPIRKISTNRPSIVDRLAARSVNGQSLDIHVHQHIGYRVHFEWDGCSKAMERRFYMYSDAETFCIEPCRFGLEGVCSCIYNDFCSHIPAKTPRCLLRPYYPTRKYFELPKWWVKSLEKSSDVDLC
jgi:hypothetical protein